jgi:TonB-dependent SusC/RagA subfamily outer membrane receptor
MRVTPVVLLLIAVCAVPILGQSTTKVQADSVMPAAPVSTLSQLLNARVPGLVVQSLDGSVGAGEQVYIRGSNQPLLIIDGVRVDNDPGGDNPAMANHPAPARFDDIDPAEIDHIDVLPGSAAAALFGPDAGNGVILVTTRRGSAKKSSGEITLEGAEVSTPDYLPQNYYAWGNAGGTNEQCVTYRAAVGACTVDSVTHGNPFASGSTTPLVTADQIRVGGSLDGTSETQRLWVGGHWASDPGTLQMPSPDKALYSENYGYSPPGSSTLANREQEGDIRAKYGFDLSKKADVDLSVGYMSQYQRDPSLDELLTSAASGFIPANDGWESATQRPWLDLANVARENAHHLNGGFNVSYRQSAAVVLHLTAGLDNVDETAGDMFSPPGPISFLNDSAFGYNHTSASGYTVDAGATLTKGDSTLRSQTTVGLQYLSQRFHDSTYQYTGATVFHTLTAFSQDRSAYGREVLTVVDHLALAGGARFDQQRFRGANLESWSFDPNLDLSLAIIGSVADPRLRIRGAMGQTTTLPGAQSAGDIYNLEVGRFNCPPSAPVCAPPATFRAERQREWETGFDASLPHDRFTIGLGIYAKRNIHELVPGELDVPFQSAPVTSLIPDAIVSDRGLEFNTSVKLVDNQSFAWDIALNASENTDRELQANNVAANRGCTQIVCQSLDHPVDGVFRLPYTYSDANNDGVIEPNEVTVGTVAQYVGPAVPTHLATATMSMQLFKRHLRLATLFDYRGGYVLPDMAAYDQALSLNAGAVNKPGAPLGQQAAVVAVQDGAGAPVQRVSAVRWRELSATIGSVGAKGVQVTLAARNLALWTKYSGDPDWDVAPQDGYFTNMQLPEPRTLLLRLTFGF